MSLREGDRIGPYEILARLGRGGMGEVFKARDTRLDRALALKTLPAEHLGDSERRRRLIVEARAAARLNHPNIVTIYDILDQEDGLLVAMEYVDGVSLDQVLAAGPVPHARALHYAGEIADALAVAHAAGVIHRDLKPANVMITREGHAKLLDFGIAKLIDPISTESETVSRLTAAHAIVGTAAYMSPEQAEGRPIDTRSDVFAFGALVYELLSGRTAFRRDSWLATLTAVLRDEPAPLRSLNPEVETAVAEALHRCLRKDPAERFPTMLEVKAALSGERRGDGRVTQPSIAVLPFVNLSEDRSSDYFGDGLAEEIINSLAKIPTLKVIARTSAFAFRDAALDLRIIGERLGVAVVLEGSVRKAGSRIRVTAQLVRVADSTHLWSERFDRELTDIFAIQDEIAEAIARALQVQLVSTSRRPVKIEAFEAYLRGLYWYQRYSAPSLVNARQAFEAALAEDPGYAPAHAGLAVFFYGLGALSLKPMNEMAPLAAAAAEKALTFDPEQREAHSVLGLVQGSVDHDWERAQTSFDLAMAVAPVPSLVRVRYGLYYLIPLGRFDEAEAQFRTAYETDPWSMMVHFGLSFTPYCAGRYREAFDHAEEATSLYPDYWLVHFAKGLAASQLGDDEEAIRSYEAVDRLAPAFSLAKGFLAAAWLRKGEGGKAAQIVQELEERRTKQYVSAASSAVFQAALGNSDAVFAALEQCFTERDPYLTRINSEHAFAEFRTDPRYRALLARMRLPERG
jgi:serine/threonine protein kinase/tetratricopeptide (TPR) repeat protein